MEVVFVRWTDAVGQHSMYGDHNANNLVPLEVTSAGILLEETGKFVRFVQDIFSGSNEDNQHREVMVIPKKMVSSIQRFKVK